MTLAICLAYLALQIAAVDVNILDHRRKNGEGRRQALIEALEAERAVLVETREYVAR